MIQLLRLLPTGPIWPYSVTQFRLDEPWLSISNFPHDEELASYSKLDPPIIVVRPVPTEPPDYDTTTHYSMEVMPVQVGDTWQQSWEIKELPPLQPISRWVDFSAVIMALPAINTMLAAVLQVAPGLYGGLVVGLQQASEGDSRVFLNSWNTAYAMGLISNELIAIVQATAIEYDLPEAFIEALVPTE